MTTKDNAKSIIIDGIKYIPESERTQLAQAQTLKGLKYCIVRSNGSGVWAGYVKSRDGSEAIILKARRIWYWDGAASLSTLAVHGTSKPENCKFPCEVEEVTILNVLEIIPCTEEAQASITSVVIWQQ